MHSSSGHSRCAKMGTALIFALPTELAYGHSEHNKNFETDHTSYVALGSAATDRHARDTRAMPALPPLASVHWHRSETPLCAKMYGPAVRVAVRGRTHDGLGAD